MKPKMTLMSLAAALLFACAAQPIASLSADPIEVSTDELSNYWVNENTNFSYNLKPKYAPKKGSEGYVTIQYLIDSNGNIFEPKVIESLPEGMWDYSGIKALTQFKYVRAQQNTNAAPVYVTTKIDFKF